ncbi:MAG: 1-acyl-sn-glycerol-3-phosphate acyltransferase [Bacteroidetes bacterium]|nr:1-acyl-sn-glycerol-3-phosphate acyltransferase [Bacteroidota bacterium]
MAQLLKKIRNIHLTRRLIYGTLGLATYPGIALFNKLKVNGAEKLKNLPDRNVLFVSNHQTYFADVIAFLHIFFAAKWGRYKRLGIPFYLLNPVTRIYYVAAAETMNDTWLTRLFAKAGAITVKRTWRAEGKEVQRGLDPADTRKIARALDTSWVITFPQGTTKPFAPGRKGTAYIIKQNQPIVVPIIINGFWRAFNKKGLKFKKRGSILSVTIKDPLVVDYNDSVDNILAQVMDAIEQSKEHMLKSKHHLIPVKSQS